MLLLHVLFACCNKYTTTTTTTTLLYGIELYDNIPSSHISNLQIVNNKPLRIAQDCSIQTKLNTRNERACPYIVAVRLRVKGNLVFTVYVSVIEKSNWMIA